MNELSIWTLKADGTAEALNTVGEVDLEDRLEGMLVQRPDMLGSDIQLVGRQTHTDGGPSDLLGVDADGRLVVFELKRGRVTRDAVTQCIDYASALDAMDPEKELAEHIAEHSGAHGIEKIDDFKAWYERDANENRDATENEHGSEMSNLLPPRLVLVGLGVDERAERMARFLQAGGDGINISVLTFYGFQHGGETLLARQVEVEAANENDSSSTTRRRRNKTANDKRQALEHNLSERGLTNLFEDIRQALSGANQIPTSGGVNFSLRFGSGLRRILGIRVVDTGLSLEFDARPNYEGQAQIYKPADLSMIMEKASQVGWSPRARVGWDQGDNFALFIKDAEDWEQKRSTVTEFLKEAAALRLRAPTSDAP